MLRSLQTLTVSGIVVGAHHLPGLAGLSARVLDHLINGELAVSAGVMDFLADLVNGLGEGIEADVEKRRSPRTEDLMRRGKALLGLDDLGRSSPDTAQLASRPEHLPDKGIRGQYIQLNRRALAPTFQAMA